MGLFNFLGDTLSSLARPVFGLVGSVFGARASARAQDRTNDMNYRIARETNQMSYQQNLDFWHRQNAYNTPAAQMQRFKDAGLNPHLIYNQSNMAGPISTPAQPVPEYKEPDRVGLMLDYLQRYQDLRTANAQEQLIQAQKNYAVQQAESSRIGNSLAIKANERADAQFQLSKALGDASIKQTNANIQFLNTRKGLVGKDIETYDERHPIASIIKGIKEKGRKYVDSMQPSWIDKVFFGRGRSK